MENYEQFEKDLKYILGDKLKSSDNLCEQLWSALANVEWFNIEKGYKVSYSFRAAGGLIAEIIEKGNYMDWYCCGPYATVSDEIGMSLKKMGWIYDGLPPICDVPMCINTAGCFGPLWGNKCSKHYKEWKKERLSNS